MSASSRVEFSEGPLPDGEEEGLVVLGCGGEWAEWVDGLDEHLREATLLGATERIAKVTRLRTEGGGTHLCVWFSPGFELNKLAIWRICGRRGASDIKMDFLRTRGIDVDDPREPLHPFECMWLSDYLDIYHPND